MLLHLERARAHMRRCGLDALIATSPLNITYFTDYVCWIDPLMKAYMMSPGAPPLLAQGYALLPLSGDPAFVVNGSLLAVNAIDTWVEDIRIFGRPGLDRSFPPVRIPERSRRFYDLLATPPRYASATEALAGALRDRRLENGRLGIEMETLPQIHREALEDALPDARFPDASNLIRMIRMVKSPEEIERLTEAARISEQAGMEALSLARPGVSIQTCVRHFRARLGEMDAAMDHFAFGYDGLGIATEPDFVLEDRHIEYVDWGCIYRSCFSDTGTTFAMRPLTGEMKRRFDVLRGSMDAGIAAIRPGVYASAVQAAMWKVVSENGLTDLFPHGHGVGLEVRDYPILVPDNHLSITDGCIDVPSDLPLETDMVLNVEAPLFMPGVGSIHLEQSVVVTETGSRPLTPQNRSRPMGTSEGL
ncbi:MAG: aminopeptidase P family protein [candidate division Zixibacteria bacterium]|nr:aminopeptidase P family protein [candidate division Zixibacteria bacterium]